MIAYKPKYFTIQELVHPWILNKIGETNSWLRLDAGCLEELDFIREQWGDEIYINQGVHDSRGLRPPNDPDGSWNSTHKQGTTFDLVPANGEIRRFQRFVFYLISSGQLKHFNTVEDFNHTPSWCHVANMNTSKRPLIIKP